MADGSYSTIEIRRNASQQFTVVFPLARLLILTTWSEQRTTGVARFEPEGDDGLLRRPGSGRPRKLEELTELELRDIVLTAPSEFGFESDLWTVCRLRRVFGEEFEVWVSNNTVWRCLREAGLSRRIERVADSISG